MPNEETGQPKSRKGRGWHGDSAGHAAAGRAGGRAVSLNRSHMVEIGRKGGETVSQNPGHMAEIGREGGETVSKDREHMASIGKKGGEARSAIYRVRDGEQDDEDRLSKDRTPIHYLS